MNNKFNKKNLQQTSFITYNYWRKPKHESKYVMKKSAIDTYSILDISLIS